MSPFQATPSHHQIFKRCARLGKVLASLAWSFACGGAMAQTQLTWDINAGMGGVQDGNGTWSVNGPNWLNPVTGTNTTWPSGTGTIAEFGNGSTGPSSSGRTITVSGTVGVAGMKFNPATNDAAYIFNGGTIQFADGAIISVLNGATGSSTGKRLTFNSILAGSNVTIAKTPSANTGGLLGAVRLYGNNTWTGTLTLLDLVNNTSDGLFVEANSAAINNLDKVVVGDRVTLAIVQANDYTVPIEIGVGSLTRGAIRFDAAGDLKGQITLRGDASISANVVTNGFDANGTVSGNITEKVAGSSLSINVNGINGMILLSGDNSFTGGVILHAGILKLGSTGALNANTPNLFTFGPLTSSSSSKILQLNGHNVSVGGLTLGNAGSTNNFVENASGTAATLTIDSRLNYSFSGIIRDGNEGGVLALAKTGTGTQTLTGANAYSGDTTVKAGTLALNFRTISDNVVNNAANISTLIMQGGTLRLEGSATAANSQQFNGLTVQSGSSTIELAQNSTTPQNLLLSLGTITRTGGYVNFVLPSGGQSAFNGITTTNAAGMLGTWATVNGEDWAAVNAGGNVVAFTGYQTVTNFSVGTNASGPIPDSPTAHVKIIDGGESGNVLLGDPNATTDIASLVVDATGPTVIEINNSADPASGTLRIGTDGAIMLAAGAGALTIGDQTTAGASLTAGGPIDNTAGNLVFYNYSTNAITVNAGVMNNGTGAVTLVKNGPGLLVLNSTTSNYSGGTVFNGGTVRIGNDRNLGAVPVSFDADNLTFNGGALQFSASMTLNSNRGITLLDGGGTINTGNFNVTYNGIISGSGDLIKSGGTTGAGNLILGNANTYTGETLITAGIIEVRHNQALGSTAGGTIVGSAGGGGPMLRLANGIVVTGETLTIYGNGNNNGALNLIGGSDAASATSATWAGDIFLGAADSRVGVSGFGTLTIAGAIRDGAASSIWFSASGSTTSTNEMGVVLLTNNSVYTGSTGIVRGTVKLGVDNALPTGTVLTVYTAATVSEITAFDLNGHDQSIAGLSSVVPNGNNDVVIVTNSDTANESTLTIDQATDQTYHGKITGNLALTKKGAGILTLTNTYNATAPAASSSTYTGKTTISGGTLALKGTGNLQGTPWIQVDQGAFFDVTGRTGGGYDLTNKTLSGTGTVTGNLTISGTSIIKPGGNSASATLAQAGIGTGTLTVNGDLTLATGGTRALFQLGGTTSSLFDPASGGDAGFFADASGGGLYDQIEINGTLNLNAGGTIKVEFAQGYMASVGDVFNLLDWLQLGAGNTFTLGDLDLSAVASWGGGLHFETDRFLSDGILYVAVPEPSKMLLLLTGILWCGFRRRRAQV
ncbi:putative secreted protein with PEP-CTERM sorting signal [Roseimicrobium gellanilyticum]|uniref:Putative secreted protein with PEP-CTERM sorting signal n=1 Tax=Roseimicrobium gellanilyticum TaxID=748857 RepID=A0A366HP56_9BACT|nr:PEP-CTERM sorting domain-containing protein [Roseimicrobium gellanilyticum]RBP43765.1 putative secreted protein with PEP-CTERM sorting signal [Roseimicrobium gellanilyticum]